MKDKIIIKNGKVKMIPVAYAYNRDNQKSNLYMCPVCGKQIASNQQIYCDCLLKMKKEIIEKVLDNRSETIPNPDFEYCTKMSKKEKELIGIKEGDCEHCLEYIKEQCRHGEFIEREKSDEELISEALDYLILELFGIYENSGE